MCILKMKPIKAILASTLKIKLKATFYCSICCTIHSFLYVLFTITHWVWGINRFSIKPWHNKIRKESINRIDGNSAQREKKCLAIVVGDKIINHFLCFFLSVISRMDGKYG